MPRLADRWTHPRPRPLPRVGPTRPGTDHTPEVRPSLSARERRSRLSRSLLVLVGVGLIWRVARYAVNPSLWGDEAFVANNLLTRDFLGLLGPLDYFQVAPIGFLWAELAVARVLGFSEWSLRLLPFLAGIASLVLQVGFARQAVDRRSALIAVGIFAASNYPVRHATEMKPYAIDLLLSLIATMLAWSIAKDRESPSRWAALGGVIAIGVWVSYPLVFVAAGLGLFLAAQAARSGSPKVLVLWVAFGLASASSWLTMYLSVGRVQSQAVSIYTERQHWGPAFPPLARPWRLPYWLLDVHTGNLLAYPMGGNNFGSVATFVLVVVGVARLWKTRPALLALLLSPLLPTFLAAAFHRYPYGTSARVSLYMAPAFCLLAGVGVVSLIRGLAPIRKRGQALALATTGLVAGILAATVVNVAQPYKNFEDYENRRAVRELAAMASPGDAWFVFDGLGGEPPRGDVMREHWLQQLAEVRYQLMALAPGPLRWVASPEDGPPPTPGRTWLIVHRDGDPHFDEARLATCLARLTDRLGAPTLHPEPLTRGESLDAYEFPRSREAP